MGKITVCCAECGSSDVRRDAWAVWIEETQEWELDMIYDDAFCMDCNNPCTIKEKEITPCSPAPQP